jgi:hypothetical protein
MDAGRAPGRARRELASYPRYGDASRAVGWLADHDFPVERVAIVGRGLTFLEQIVGRVGLADAVLRGALVGGVVGVLVGWLFAIFAWLDPEIAWGWLIVDGLWFGALVGALLGAIQHALARGRRDFASVPGMWALEYVVLVDEDVAGEAARLLRELRERPAAEAPRRRAAVGRRRVGWLRHRSRRHAA